MSKKTITPLQVATAIAQVSKRAGQAHGTSKPQTVKQRARNLVTGGERYGAYIVKSKDDPGEWAPRAAVVIYMEPHGDPGDCEIPFDYYGDGIAVANHASGLMPGGYYIEFVNAAVAAVYEI